MSVSENELLRMIGLDGYMLLRYVKVCFKAAFFSAFFGVTIMLPIYSMSDGEFRHDRVWNRYTLANLRSLESKHQTLWIPVAFAYLFTTYFCVLMYGEYKNFMEKRIEYLAKGDPTTHPQTYYTLMVERVPRQLRSNPALFDFFDTLFPGEG